MLWPCWWSAALAGLAAYGSARAAFAPFPHPGHLALFMIGAIAMRGAGCTYNDLVDQNIDGQVARTRSRPLPSGQVSRRQAKLFLTAQALVGLLVLVQFNLFTIGFGILSLAVVAIYPFMKRVTDWPQLTLGLAFSWGAWMGWAAIFGEVGLAPALLYAGAILWTIGYDTIYAHQDKDDDALVGVRSTARLFGARTKPWLVALYAGCLSLVAAAFIAAGVPVLAYLGLLAAAVHMGRQIRILNIDDAEQCLRLFKSNTGVGWLIFLGLLVGAFAEIV